MLYLRIMCHGRANKPLPSALVTALPAIKTALTDLHAYFERLNLGKANEEATNRVTWGDRADCIWWNIDGAIPMPLSPVVQNRLTAARTKLQQLKTYAVNTGMVAFFGRFHICKHNESPVEPCVNEQEI